MSSSIEEEHQPVTIYTGVHFLVGVIFGLLGVPFLIFLGLHIIFELIENSCDGILAFARLSNHIEKMTGKQPWQPYNGDSVLNSVLDTTFAALGWAVGFHLFR